MKSVKEWLEELEEPYRTQALNNLESEFESMHDESLSEALKGAFVWSETPEGDKYWRGLVKYLESEE